MRTGRVVAIAAVIAAAIYATHASAQSGAQVYSSFLLSSRAPNIVAGPASTNESFGLPIGVSAPVARVCNTGPVIAYVAVGGVTVAADPNLSMPVLPGACVSLNATGSTNIAAITDPLATDTSTLLVMLGSGSP